MNLETFLDSKIDHSVEAILMEIDDLMTNRDKEMFNTLSGMPVYWPIHRLVQEDFVKQLLDMYNGHGVSHIIIKPK